MLCIFLYWLTSGIWYTYLYMHFADISLEERMKYIYLINIARNRYIYWAKPIGTDFFLSYRIPWNKFKQVNLLIWIRMKFFLWIFLEFSFRQYFIYRYTRNRIAWICYKYTIKLIPIQWFNTVLCWAAVCLDIFSKQKKMYGKTHRNSFYFPLRLILFPILGIILYIFLGWSEFVLSNTRIENLFQI